MTNNPEHNHRSFKVFSKDFNEEYPSKYSRKRIDEVYTVRPTRVLRHIKTGNMNLILIKS